MLRSLLVLCVLASLTSCAFFKQPDKLVLQPAYFSQMQGWAEDDHSAALATFLKSCDAFASRADDARIGRDVLQTNASTWKSVCREAALVPADDEDSARKFFEASFTPMRALNNYKSTGLFTGYYEPLLKGSRTRRRPYIYPIYALPKAGTPSYSRAEIDNGALQGRAHIIAYTDDPVKLFFLQVQGSGRVRLTNGKVLRIGYAGANGQKYVSIGKVLADKGILKKEDITGPLLRQWLYDHPWQMWQVLEENPSYVYFRLLKTDPVGTEQVPLTPGRSLAVDVHYISLGMPVFLDTTLPATSFSPAEVYRKLMVAQDTGGAIRGPVRGDIFFGFGKEAEELAGCMKADGQVVLLVPNVMVRP